MGCEPGVTAAKETIARHQAANALWWNGWAVADVWDTIGLIPVATMTFLFYVQFIGAIVLVFVIAATLLAALERRFPAFSRWLDRVVGEEPVGRGW